MKSGDCLLEQLVVVTSIERESPAPSPLIFTAIMLVTCNYEHGIGGRASMSFARVWRCVAWTLCEDKGCFSEVGTIKQSALTRDTWTFHAFKFVRGYSRLLQARKFWGDRLLRHDVRQVIPPKAVKSIRPASKQPSLQMQMSGIHYLRSDPSWPERLSMMHEWQNKVLISNCVYFISVRPIRLAIPVTSLLNSRIVITLSTVFVAS